MTATTDFNDEALSTPPPTPSVATAVLFVGPVALGVALDSVAEQVYGVERTAVIGGGAEGAQAATDRGVQHAPDLATYMASFDTDIDYVWILHGDARPRPDALGALVAEAERNEAAVVGSKVLDAQQPDRLESVGSATDVFGEPYGGLDPDEVDLEQYDVVRDVSFVPAVSALVRRDLLRGLGGIDPDLPPISAGLDLSQRARIAGGRVMVAPSAEVLHARLCREDVAGWREQAGRMRAMLKAYRMVTLIWAIPFGWLVWLLDAVARLFLGSVRPLRDLLLATGWNLAKFPSTVGERNRVRRIRATTDEELFRYQVSGSVRLRELGADLATRFGWIIDQEPGVITEEEMEKESSAAAAIAAVLAIILVVLGTRALWLGATPSVGYWLPVGDEPWSVLTSYAGGWNPAGLGSTETVHPSAAIVALVQWALGGWSAAPNLIAFVSMAAGALGIPRLLSRLGVGSASRFFAAAVYVLGPFIVAFGSSAYWPGMIALGPIPWLVDAVIAPAGHGRRLWGKIGKIVFTVGIVAAFAPLGILVPLLVVIAALPSIGVRPFRPGIGWWALVALVAGADLIASYLLGRAPSQILGDAPQIDVWPALPWVAAMVVAAVFTVVSAEGARSRAAGWGGTMVVLALASQVVSESSTELSVAAVLLGSLGSAVVVGAAVRIDLASARTRIAGQTVGAAAGIVVIVAALLAVPSGRATMPEDRWGDILRFAAQLESPAGTDRILIVGSAETIPGDHRTRNGYAYRLVTTPGPTIDQAWLSAPRIGDRALEDALAAIERGADARPGALLAEFAIRWVVVEDDSQLLDRLVAQVDLEETLVEPGVVILENLAFAPRVLAENGSDWVASRAGAVGPAFDGRVRFADNADPGWAPGWSQEDWANDLSGATGELWFRGDRLRTNLAVISLLIMAVAGGLAVWGRERS